MAGITAAVCRKPSLHANQQKRLTHQHQQALSNNSITDFVIIEYNDRVGGRATQTNFGKKEDGSPYVVELGPNWVCVYHGGVFPAVTIETNKLEIRFKALAVQVAQVRGQPFQL